MAGSMQRPPQSTSPDWQVRPQLPPEHTVPLEQALPQAPQFALSVEGSTQTPLHSIEAPAHGGGEEPHPASAKSRPTSEHRTRRVMESPGRRCGRSVYASTGRAPQMPLGRGIAFERPLTADARGRVPGVVNGR